MIHFGALPPEINSGRMYAGLGSAPMLAAAAAWDTVGAELRVAASSFTSVVSGLSAGVWRGPASMSMAAVTATHITWVHATAGIAEQTAAQARAVAAAFEVAFAMTVPPPVIATNRALLASLVATNFLGQNTPAIAAAEAHYAEMWAQDAAAMYGYADSTAVASRLTPFTAPEQAAEEGGELPPAEEPPPSGLQPGTAAPDALQEPVTPGTPPAGTTPPKKPPSLWEVWGRQISPIEDVFATPSRFFGTGDKFVSAFGSRPAAAGAATDGAEAAVGVAGFPGLGGLPGGVAGNAPVTASVGKAGSIGGLSVPTSWASAAPENASPLPLRGVGGAAEGPTGNNLLRGMPLTGAGAGRRSAGGFVHRYGFRHSVIPRPTAVG